MSKPLAYIYLAFWGCLCMTALLITWSHRKQCLLFQRRYWHFLLKPWKIVTFLLATLGLIVLAPHMDDPTWDFWTSSFMGILTFLTAPFAIGIFYRFKMGRDDRSTFFVALCLMFFSASWSYDLYLFLRDGSYTPLWLANMAASSMLYIVAGLMWNLTYSVGKGVGYAFKENDWPTAAQAVPLRKILWPVLAFMLVVCIAMAPFIVPFIKMLWPK